MNRLTIQQKWLLVAAAIVIVNVGVWLYGLSPAMDQVSDFREEKTQLEKDIDASRILLRRYMNLDIEALELEMQKLNILVPSQGLVREFLAEIEETANDIGISLNIVRAATPRDSAPYRALDMSLDLSGTYEQVSAYLSYLENNPRLVVVRSMNLGGGEQMRFSVDITIYAESFSEYTPYQAPGRDNPFE